MTGLAKRLASAATTAALFIVAIGAASIAGAQDISVNGVALAQDYAGFARGQVVNHEDQYPGVGFSVPYHGGPAGKATVYVYDLGQSAIPDGTAAPAVRKAFDEAAREVIAIADYFPHMQAELVNRCVSGTRGDPNRQFLCAEFIVTENDIPRRSYLYLTGAHGRFLKIRVTVQSNDPDDPTAHDFADAVGNKLWGR